MAFRELVLKKIIKFAATRCHILKLKCTKSDFGWASVPDPAGGEYSDRPDLLAGFKGLLLTEGEGREWRGRTGEYRQVGEGRCGREGRFPTSSML